MHAKTKESTGDLLGSGFFWGTNVLRILPYSLCMHLVSSLCLGIVSWAEKSGAELEAAPAVTRLREKKRERKRSTRAVRTGSQHGQELNVLLVPWACRVWNGVDQGMARPGGSEPDSRTVSTTVGISRQPTLGPLSWPIPCFKHVLAAWEMLVARYCMAVWSRAVRVGSRRQSQRSRYDTMDR